MAIVQYTGIVNQIRGKLNGSVFNKARNVNTLQRKQQTPRRSVGFQSEPRNTFSSAQRSWKELSGIQQTQWATAASNNPSRDRFGELVALSGYNQYIKAYIFAVYTNQTPPTTPDTSPAPAVDVTDTNLQEGYFDVSGEGTPRFNGDLSLTGTGGGSSFRTILDIGIPISTGTTVYYGRRSFVATAQFNNGSSLQFSTNLGPRYPYPQSGQNFSIRARVIYIPNGSVVFETSEITFVAF